MNKKTIGIFDSGLGGITAAEAINKEFPYENILFVGDTKNAPYGNRTNEEIKGFVDNITNHLVEEGVKMIVIACNTATINSYHLKLDIPVIGITEHTIKDTLNKTKTKNVLVMATSVTIASGIYQKRLKEEGINVVGIPCPKLVPLIEGGKIKSKEMTEALHEYLDEHVNSEIDTVVIGCTHYGHLKDQISEILPNVLFADGINEVFGEVRKMQNLEGSNKGTFNIEVSGDPISFSNILNQLNVSFDSIKKI